MRRTCVLLTIAAVVSVGSTTQSKSSTLLRANLHAQEQAFQQRQLLVETTAATMFGGSDPIFAELQDQAANQITWGFFDQIKDRIGGFAKGALDGARKQYLGFSEVSSKKLDGQVAQYILTELANGNPEFLKALSQIAHSSVRSAGSINAQVNSQVEAQIQAEISQSVWEKIKNFFSRKSSAQTKNEAAAIEKLLNAEVSSYLQSKSEGVFEDLKMKISRAQQSSLDSDNDGIPDWKELDADNDGIPDYLENLRAEVTEKDIEDAVSHFVLSQAASGDAFFDFGEIMKKFNKIKDKIAGMKDMLASNINNIKDQVVSNVNQIKDTATGASNAEAGAQSYADLTAQEQWFWDNIRNAVSSKISDAVNAGKKKLEEAKNGVMGAAGGLANGVMGNAMGALQGVMGGQQ